MDNKEEEEGKVASVSSPALCSVSPPALCSERGGERHNSTATTGNGRDERQKSFQNSGAEPKIHSVCFAGLSSSKTLNSHSLTLRLALSSLCFSVCGKQPPPWTPGEALFNKKRRCPLSHRWREVSWNSSRPLSGLYGSSRFCWEPGFGSQSQPTSMRAPFTMCFSWPCFSGSSR